MLLLHLTLWIWFNLAVALRNITVDDQSSSIQYSPASEWIPIEDTLDANGGHMLTNFIRAEATITFTFLNMYYMSTRWHYHVGAVIDVDGQEGIADMRDYTAPPDLDTLRATMASSVVWSYKGDGMKERTVTVKVPRGDTLTVLDMFIFEVDDEPTTLLPGSTLSPSPTSATSSAPASSPSSSLTTSPSPSPSSSFVTDTSHGLSSQSKALIISLSIVGAALLALLLFFLYWFHIRNPSKKEDQVEKVLPVTDKPAGKDGKACGSPRASIGQASNSPSSDEEQLEKPIAAHHSTHTSTVVTTPPPERRPTIITRPVPVNLHRNPTTVSVQHGLDIPRVSRNAGQGSSNNDTNTTLEAGMIMDDD